MSKWAAVAALTGVTTGVVVSQDAGLVNVAAASTGATILADSHHETAPPRLAIDGSGGSGPEVARPTTHWIWDAQATDGQGLYLQRQFTLEASAVEAALWATCDDAFVAYLNGQPVATGDLWVRPVQVQGLASHLVVGSNHLCVEARNGTGPAGLRLRLAIRTATESLAVETDGSWQVFGHEPLGWPGHVTQTGRSATVLDPAPWAHAGNLVSPWRSQVYKSHPHWLWVRFRQPAVVSRLVLVRGGPIVPPDGPVGPFRAAETPSYPVDFVAEYSPDCGRTFRPLLEVTDNRMEDTSRCHFGFRPVTTDNLRLRILRSAHPQLIYRTELAELEVLGRFVPAPATRQRSDDPLPKPRLMPDPDSPELSIRRGPDAIEYRSPWLRVAFAASAPRILALSWDSLGQGEVDESFLGVGPDGGCDLAYPRLFPEAAPAADVRFEVLGDVVRYHLSLHDARPALWELRLRPRGIETVFAVGGRGLAKPPMPTGLRLPFTLAQRCIAPLVIPGPDHRAPLPLLLHAADRGSVLVSSPTASARLRENQRRNEKLWEATLDLLSPRARSWRLELRVVNAPELPSVGRLPAPPATPRHWLNGFQYHPWTGMLGNNMFNESTAIVLYFYADLAAYTPRLPGGVEPMAMVRESVDGYLHGAPGYAKVPDLYVERWMDAPPSVLIAAWDVIRVTGDRRLLGRWLPHLERLGARIEEQDRDGDGLPEALQAGRAGDFSPCNWWDTINFGHQDAYACALCYRALNCLADLEALAGRQAEADHFARLAERLHAAYVPAFLNPETGIIAGWRDRDGRLHDYWFTWINGMAIVHGLVSAELAQSIMGRFQARLAAAGFSRFDLGLPGNLVPIRREDYAPCGLAFGQGERADGADGFQRYENGGACASFAYYYLQALYQVGRRDEADLLLDALFRGYAAGVHQNGQWNAGEWRDWAGNPTAGEGYLADSYHAAIAWYTGHLGVCLTPAGFRRQPWAPPWHEGGLKLGLRSMGRTVKAVR